MHRVNIKWTITETFPVPVITSQNFTFCHIQQQDFQKTYESKFQPCRFHLKQSQFPKRKTRIYSLQLRSNGLWSWPAHDHVNHKLHGRTIAHFSEVEFGLQKFEHDNYVCHHNHIWSTQRSLSYSIQTIERASRLSCHLHDELHSSTKHYTIRLHIWKYLVIAYLAHHIQHWWCSLKQGLVPCNSTRSTSRQRLQIERTWNVNLNLSFILSRFYIITEESTQLARLRIWCDWLCSQIMLLIIIKVFSIQNRLNDYNSICGAICALHSKKNYEIL